MSTFTIPQESIAGLPTIEFTFDDSRGAATLAGATMRSQCQGPDDATMSIRDARGHILADIAIRRAPSDENITESVLRIGSALLWSHARYVEAKAATP